jgi:hypothetical protein
MHDGERDRQRERLLVVAVADNSVLAGFIREQLEQSGIPSTVRNREGGAAIIGGIGGTYEISVLEGDAERASAILAEDGQPDSLPPPQLSTSSGEKPKRRRWWR